MRNYVVDLPDKATQVGIHDMDVKDFEVYKDFVQSEYRSPIAKKTLLEGFTDVQINTPVFKKGVTPFKNLVFACLNEDKKPGSLTDGTYLATRDDIEIITKRRPKYFSKLIEENKFFGIDSFYIDAGLVVSPVPEDVPENKKMYQDIMLQLNKLQLAVPTCGLYIPFTVLDKPHEVSNTKLGLGFSFRDFSATELRSKIFDVNSFSWDKKSERGISRVMFQENNSLEWTFDEKDFGFSSKYGYIFGASMRQRTTSWCEHK